MSATTRIRAAADELVSLRQRLRYMQHFRLGLSVGVVAYAAYAPEVLGATVGTIARGAALYLLLSLIGEWVWRTTGGRSLLLFGGMLILDGLYLAWLAYATGGIASVLLPLVLLHLVAVTLLASYRTGLKLTMWHSLLILSIYYAQEARVVVPGIPGTPPLPPGGFSRLVGFVAIFWLVALSTATFSAVNERELRRRRYDLEALARMASSLEEANVASEVARVLLMSLLDTFRFSRGVVIGALGTRQATVLAMEGKGVLAPVEGVAEVDRVITKAREDRTTLLVSDLDPSTNPALAQMLPDAENLLVVPLTAEGLSVGAVVVEYGQRSSGRIERRVVSTVERFCSHASLALRNASLVRQLRTMAATDGLTKISNRRTFESALEIELSRAEHAEDPVTLVMLDIDHFKKFNDEHGHRMGDEVLIRVAETLKRQCRQGDQAFRYGGEEFAILLPGCSAEDAATSGDRFRRAIVDMDGPLPVTVSVGTATFPGDAVHPEDLVKRADAALYESKHLGRNRVTAYREPEPEPAPEPAPEPEPAARPDVRPGGYGRPGEAPADQRWGVQRWG